MEENQKRLKNTSITYFCLIVGFVVIRILAAFNLFSFMGKAESYIFNILIQIGLMFCLTVFLFNGLQKQKLRRTFKEYGFKKISFNAVVICVLIGILVFILNVGVSSFFNFFIRLFGYSPNTSGAVLSEYPVWMLFVNLLFTAVLPGICEEVAHRGMLLNGIKGLGYKKAILLSSLMFGLMHLNIEQFFYATIIGILLAILRIITGSIVPSMIVHFMNNAISVYITFAAVNGLPFGDISGWLSALGASTNQMVVMLFVFLVLCLSLGLLLFLVFQLFKETTVKDLQRKQTELAKKVIKESLMEDIARSQKAILEPDIVMEPDLPKQEEIYQNPYIKVMGANFDLDYPLKPTIKPNKYYKLFMNASIYLASAITLFTFIWGIL